MGAGPEPHAQTHAEPHAQASAQPRAQPRAEAANESMGTFAFKDGSKAEKGIVDAMGNGEAKIRRPDGSFHEGTFVG